MLGLSEPQKDDETIGGIIDNANFESKDYVQENNNKIVSLSNRQLSVNNESIYDESFQDDYIEIEDDIIKVLEDALNRCKDFEEMKKELDRLTLDWDMEKVSKLMAATFFISRAKGDNDFNKDEE